MAGERDEEMADLLLLRLRRCLVIRLTVDCVPSEIDWFTSCGLKCHLVYRAQLVKQPSGKTPWKKPKTRLGGWVVGGWEEGPHPWLFTEVIDQPAILGSTVILQHPHVDVANYRGSDGEIQVPDDLELLDSA